MKQVSKRLLTGLFILGLAISAGELLVWMGMRHPDLAIGTVAVLVFLSAAYQIGKLVEG